MPLFTNVIRWRLGRFGQDDFRNPKIAQLVRKDLKHALVGGEHFRLRLRSQKVWFSSRDLTGIMFQVERLMPKIPVGESILVERESDGVIWALRKSRERLRLPIKDTAGNDDIDKIYTWVLNDADKHGIKVGSLGICNRRPIAGTSSWSEHSPWGPPDPGANAWDPAWKTLHDQEEAVKRIVAAAERGEIPVGYVISNRRQWKKGEGWSSYGGLDPHTGHAHIQGLRWHSGQTPKASC